jgi:predicted nucleic acid-binding protein
MTNYFLDTSIIIEYLRGNQETIDLVNELEGKTSTSVICLSELYEGVFHSSHPEKNKKVIHAFFHGLNEVYSLNTQIAERFGQIRARLRQKGQMIEDLDIFIAATCLEQGCIMVTRNLKHFERISNLQLYQPL